MPTSIELFRRGYRSVYVNEIGETLSSCFDETTRLATRVQELFDVHHTATEVLFSDPLGLLKARYTSPQHRLFIIEDLWQGLFTVRACVTARVGACKSITKRARPDSLTDASIFFITTTTHRPSACSC